MIKLLVVTPEKKIYEDIVDMVVVPGVEGALGILPHHTSLFTQIKPGEIKIKKGGTEEYLAAAGGFIEVQSSPADSAGRVRSRADDKAVTMVTILADYAVKSEEIEEAKVLEAKKKAEEAMKNREDKVKFVQAESQLRRAVLELKVSSKRKKALSK